MTYVWIIILAVWIGVVHHKLTIKEKEIRSLQERMNMLGYADLTREQNRTQPNLQKPPQVYPYQPPKAQKAPPKRTGAEENKSSVENILGKNIVGIAASALIFIGLIFLGILVYDYISEAVKIVFMYAFSAAVTALGTFLTLKKRNNFNIILTGCGCGSVFISILLTHIYFGRINDVTAFSLIAVWMALTFFLAKKTGSVILSIVTHIGMTVSLCFAYAVGINDEKLAAVLVYQVVSTVIIVVGNILCSKKTYNLGLILSIILSVTASARMISVFTSPIHALHGAETSVPAAALAAVFALQFAGTSFLSYLLSVSANNMKGGDSVPALHVFNKILWSASLAVNVLTAVYRMAYRYTGGGTDGRFEAAFAAVSAGIIILALHTAITVLMSYKLNFKDTLENISVSCLAAIAGAELLSLWIFSAASEKYNMYVIGYIVPAAVFLIMAKHFKNRVYRIISKVFLCLDIIFSVTVGYGLLTGRFNIYAAFVYMLLYLLYIWTEWYTAPETGERRERKFKMSKIFSFFAVEASAFSIFVSSDIKNKGLVLLIFLTALNFIVYSVKFDRFKGEKTAFSHILCANEYILLTVSFLITAYMQRNESNYAALMLLTISSGFLAFARIPNTVRKDSHIVEQSVTGLKLTLYTLSVLNGNTNVLQQAYVLSLICMLTALISVVSGFIFNIKSMRIYGLALTLICVMKLVTFDVSGQSTLLRVISLIGGGIICFIISAIYNYYEKHAKSSL